MTAGAQPPPGLRPARQAARLAWVKCICRRLASFRIRSLPTSARTQLASIPPDDIAEAITWARALPQRFNVARLIALPTAQG